MLRIENRQINNNPYRYSRNMLPQRNSTTPAEPVRQRLHSLNADIMRANGLIFFSSAAKVPEVSREELKKGYDELWELIKSQQKSPTMEDVQSLVKNVQKETQAKKEDVCYALAKLTQFANISGLDEGVAYIDNNIIPKCRKEYKKSGGVKTPGEVNPVIFKLNNCISLQDTIDYLCEKGQLVLDTDSDLKLFVFDKEMAQTARIIKEDCNFDYENLSKRFVFVHFEGWEKGLHIYNQSSDLSELQKNASEIIKKAKAKQKETGSTFKEAFSEVVDEDVLKEAEELGIKVHNVSITPDKTSYTQIDEKWILDNLEPLKISKKDVVAIIESMGDLFYPFSESDKRRAKKLITGYLKSELDIYTPQRLGERFKEINKSINEKVREFRKADGTPFNPEEVIYIIPTANKSYTPTAMNYAEVNKINKRQFILADQRSRAIRLEDNKVYVVLDDYFGTGSSILEEFYFRTPSPKIPNSRILLCPVVAGETAIASLHEGIMERRRVDKDFLILDENHSKKRYDNTEYFKSLPPEDRGMLLDIMDQFSGSSRYGALGLEEGPFTYYEESQQGGYAICFPYMSPDNNAALPSLFFEYILLIPGAVNALKNHCIRSSEFYIGLKNKIFAYGNDAS